MPDAAKVLLLVRRAAALNRATRGRRGQVVHVEAGEDALVCGDLHGNIGNFRQVLATADLAAHPRRHLVLQELVHGPFRYPGTAGGPGHEPSPFLGEGRVGLAIARPASPPTPTLPHKGGGSARGSPGSAEGGDTSHQLVDLFAALKGQYPDRVHWVLGNHELAEITGRRIAKDQGAPAPLFRRGVERAYGPRADDVMAAYRELFASLPLAVRTPNGVFISHSIPSPGALEAFDASVFELACWPEEAGRPGGWVYELVWGRDLSQEAADGFARLVAADWLITGHERAPEGFAAPNGRQLVLDTSGRPAAVCLLPAGERLDHGALLGAVRVLGSS